MRPLTTSGVRADDSATYEHIFPESVWGVVKTRDCCKGCNNWLGHTVDKMLLADERVILAAREAGIKESQILSRFSGTGRDSLNRPARYTVQDAQWRLEPDFDPRGFRIGMIEGKIFPRDLQNAKAKMRSLVAADNTLQLTAPEIAKAVDELFGAFLAKPGGEAVYSQKIRQGIRGGPGPAHIKLDGAYDPRKTERAIAKIAYEVAVALLPAELFAKVWSALDQLKVFVWRGEAARPVFARESAEAAQRWHAANVRIVGDSLRFAVTLFGKETWKLSFDVLERRRPARLDAFEITLCNSFPAGGHKVGKVVVNGHDGSSWPL